MAKKESTFINMLLTLFVITFIASTALALVYNATKDIIVEASLSKKVEAIKEVAPEFNNDPFSESKTILIGIDSVKYYIVRKNNNFSGLVVESVSHNGFSGDIKIITGFYSDGTINNVTVIEHNETPGLGDKIDKDKSSFALQFSGKNPVSFKPFVKIDGGDVDAITASTISSKAFCDAVQLAVKAFNIYISNYDSTVYIN